MAEKRSGLYLQKQKGGMFAIVEIGEHPADIYFVDSTHDEASDVAGNGKNPDAPFATIDYAIASCTANKGDIIYVMPGHTETVTEAAGIALDVAGIRIIGIGNGNNRPTITFNTATTADLDVDAADISIENLRFIGGIASLAAPIDVNAARFTMRNCDFQSSGAGYGVFISVITDAAANDMTIEGCNFQYLVATDGSTAITQTSTEVIRLVGADRAVIKDCYFSGDFTTSAINGITTASKDIKILDNIVNNIATENIAGAIDLVAACTGFIDGNTCHVTYGASAAALIDDSSCVLGINYVNNATSEAPAVHGGAEAIGVEAKIDVIDAFHDVPAKDTTDDVVMSDVVGKKEDDAAAGAVTTTESLVAYAKQIVGEQIVIDAYHDVPTADTSDDAQMRDVVGKKDDAAVTTVGTTKSLMAHLKGVMGFHTVPAKDTTDDAQTRDVVGKKDDTAVTVVGTTKSLMAHLKGVMGFHTVPAKDTTDDAQMRDVVGKKEDDAAAGAVTTTESLVAYAKQIVGEQIVIDAYHDVPAKDTTDDAQMRDVVGKKEDDAAAGAVTTTESLVAYAKQIVGEQIVIDAYHDVPAADTTDNTQLRDVVGNKTDAAADGVVSATESSMAYLKQLVGQDKGIVLHEVTFTDVGDGATGSHALFTVTGTIRCRVLAICTTNLAIQTGATLEVGIVGDTASLIAQTAGDAPDAGEIWHDNSPDASLELDSVYTWRILANGTDITFDVATDTIDSGVMEFYCEWERISSDGNVVAA